VTRISNLILFFSEIALTDTGELLTLKSDHAAEQTIDSRPGTTQWKLDDAQHVVCRPQIRVLDVVAKLPEF